MFYLQRNNKLLNNYNAAIVLKWMANLDTSPAISVAVIVNYISKYCSKKEKKLVSYKELLKTVTLYTNKLYTFSSIIAKFINKLISK